MLRAVFISLLHTGRVQATDLNKLLTVEEAFIQLRERVWQWLTSTIVFLPNILAAIVVWLLWYGFYRLVRSRFRQLFYQAFKQPLLASLTYNLSVFLWIITGIAIVLTILGLDKSVTSVLAGLGIAGLTLGLAFQDLAVNFISGLMLAIRSPFQAGDFIETGTFQGTVLSVTLRNTHLRAPDGREIVVPNRQIYQNPLINHFSQKALLVTVTLPLDPQGNWPAARDLALALLTTWPHRLLTPDPSAHYTRVTENFVEFVCGVWVNPQRHPVSLARTELTVLLVAHLQEHGIALARPPLNRG
jgi:small-conductance mechanosensitive channel